MTDKDVAITNYYSLNPKDFSILVRLEIQQVVPPKSS
jgi:hypothetical protein